MTYNNIFKLTQTTETRIRKNPLLNLDTFIIPSPFVRDSSLVKDYNHSYIWVDEREILGYMLVYSDEEKKIFHIYKIVVSPFGRGKGIGQSFIKYLAMNVPDDSEIYLYLWEKQADTLEFFKEQGFKLGDTIVYRNLVYYLITADKNAIISDKENYSNILEEHAEIGKTRHDARKLVRLLSHMVDSLSSENCDKIVEDINRETTTLINILNYFRDSRKIMHEVNLRELILYRIVPYIQASPIKCCLQVKFNTKNTVVLGYHENIGRALINIISNSLDAIEEKGIKGAIKISLAERKNEIILSIRDNGAGIPPELLEKDVNGIPLFVGKTTKQRKAGEGLGTIQIYSTFGDENINVTSSKSGTGWKIAFKQSGNRIDQRFVKMNRRYNEFSSLWENFDPEKQLSRNDVIRYIWQLRKMEIFLFDLILMFSTHNNIRTIYRQHLSFIHSEGGKKSHKEFIFSLQSDKEILKEWFYEISKEIKTRFNYLKKNIPDFNSYCGALLKSYGQSLENVIIFTIDPETGNFLASDRKLAEHLDFVQYLGKPREQLLRGEFSGDINNDDKPVTLGVWTIKSEEDLMNKLKLIKQAAQRLIDNGIHASKRLAFYQTTYPNHSRDIDSDKSTTLEKITNMPDMELKKFIKESEENEISFMMQID